MVKEHAHAHASAKKDARSGLEQTVRSFQDVSLDLTRSSGRFVEAVVKANTELAVGSVQVFSDLLVNLAEASVPRRPDPDEKPRDVAKIYTDTLTNSARHLNTAFAESGKVLQRSAERFATAFEDDEDEAPVAKTGAA